MKKKAFLAAGGIVSLLTILFHGPAELNPVLLLAVYPGLMANLLVTGGHGGTRTQDRVGFALEFVVSVFVYGLAALAVLRIARKSH